MWQVVHVHFAYTIVAPQSPHGGDAFDDVDGKDGCDALTFWIEESTIFVWTIGVFVESVVVDSKIDLCTLSEADSFGEKKNYKPEKRKKNFTKDHQNSIRIFKNAFSPLKKKLKKKKNIFLDSKTQIKQSL